MPRSQRGEEQVDVSGSNRQSANTPRLDRAIPSRKACFCLMVYYLSVAMVLHRVYDTRLSQDHELLAVLSALVSFGWCQWTLSRASHEAGEF